jgi:hypothetical protein
VTVYGALLRASDYYKLVVGQDRWWDASDSASIYSQSFNRYAEWLRLWNEKSQKRWGLWQIPLGNSNHLNVANNVQADYHSLLRLRAGPLAQAARAARSSTTSRRAPEAFKHPALPSARSPAARRAQPLARTR